MTAAVAALERIGAPRSLRGWLRMAAWLAIVAAIGAALPGLLASLPSSFAILMAPALVVASIVVVLAFATPALLVVAAFGLLSVVRVEPGPTDLLFCALIGATALRMPRPMRVSPPILTAAAGFGLISLIAMVNAIAISRALRFESITIYLLVSAVWLTSMLDEPTLLRRAVKAYIVGAVASALLGVAAVKAPFFPGAASLRFGTERAQGFFKDPNVFGPFMVPAAAIVLEELGRPRLLGWSRRRLLVVLAILATGNVYAFSRAAWLNLGLAFLVVGGVYAWRRGGFVTALRIGAAVTAVGLAGFGMLAATNSLGFLRERGKLEQGYDTSRFSTQANELHRLTVHVFGYGPGQSEAQLNFATHSMYVRAIFEEGPLGIALLAAIMLGTLATAAALAYHDVDIHGLGSAALLAAWLGLIANGFFVDTLHWRHLWVVAALIWLGASRLGRSADADGATALPADASLVSTA